MVPRTAFILGATGFVGGHLVELLGRKHPELRLLCLVRDATPEKAASLKSLSPRVDVVEGTLEDSEVISRTSEKVDIVIHIAHSDHAPSVEAVLAGLSRRGGDSRPAPLYLHMSGCGIIADNVRGEYIDNPKEWTDVDLRLDDCPSDNTHLASDRKIQEAGLRSEHRIRTSILFPGLIYGLGKTPRSGAWVPFYSTFAKAAGHAGTWGPGEVSQDCVHVRDVVSAVLCVLNAMLEGKIRGGDDGLFFVTSREPSMSWREINVILGDIMYSRGLVKESGAKPFPASITEPLGHYGWSLLGSNGRARADRLHGLGWTAEWSEKEPLQTVIKEMLEIGVV